MLGQIEDLTYVPRDQVLIITTQDAAAEHLEVHVYRVDDILAARENFNGTDGREDFDGLIEVIVSSVERDSWLENDTGEGEIHPLQPGMLVIANTYQVHQQIARLLTDIRETRRYIGASKDQPAALAQPITRGFKIDVVMGENPDLVKGQISEAVMQSIDWDMANSEQTEKQIWLKVLPDRLLVRHLPSVVHQVERVVADMKLAK